MKKKTAEYENYIEEYWNGIKTGKYIVCQKIHKLIEKLIYLQQHPGKYHFDEKLACHPITFIEKYCKTSKGELGKPIKLELFQKVFIQALYGFVDDNNIRKHNEAILIVGRKNGKSTLTSALGIYGLCGDGEGGAEVDCVSTKRDAAKIVFDEARNMVAQSPMLSKKIKKRKSDMYYERKFSKFQPLSSDSQTLDGLNPSFACIDECHAVKDRNLYDVIKQAMTARRQPILLIITTSGFYREGIYDNLYAYSEKVLNGDIDDEHFLPFIYELDSTEEWTNPECYVKANPGLGTIKSAETLLDNVERAKNDMAFRPTVWTKDFNLKNVSSDTWLTWEQLDNEETFEIDDVINTYALGGCDLSATTDLTCATLLIRKRNDEKLYVLQHYFLPQERIDKLEATTTKEAPYKTWADRGLLTLCQGSMVNYADVTAWFQRMRDEYKIDMWRCGYDRALAGYWAEEMCSVFGDSVMEKVVQGPITWTAPMKELGAMLADKMINYNNNPMLKWCLSNTGVKVSGTVESIQPVKIQQNRRIDGMVSLLNAYTIYVKYREDYLNLVG